MTGENPAHFEDPDTRTGPFEDATHTMCGLSLKGMSGLWRNNPKADCRACTDAWSERTGWTFPLPELFCE